MKENEIEKQIKYIANIHELLNGKNKKFSIYTMGCTLNENDSEKISGMATQMGYTKTENILDADLIIFNTCCIRENAEEKLFGKLGEVKKLKEDNNVIIAVCGCKSQQQE